MEKKLTYSQKALFTSQHQKRLHCVLDACTATVQIIWRTSRDTIGDSANTGNNAD